MNFDEFINAIITYIKDVINSDLIAYLVDFGRNFLTEIITKINEWGILLFS